MGNLQNKLIRCPVTEVVPSPASVTLPGYAAFINYIQHVLTDVVDILNIITGGV